MFLVIGIRRLRFCHAEPNYRLSELGQPSPVTVVPLVALPPQAIFLRMPATRQQANALRILLSSRIPNTRLAKFLCELGCSRSTPAAPHEAARLCQQTTLGLACSPSVIAGCPNILSVPALPLRPHHLRVCHTLRSAIVVPCASRHEDAAGSVSHASISRPSRPIPEVA